MDRVALQRDRRPSRGRQANRRGKRQRLRLGRIVLDLMRRNVAVCTLDHHLARRNDFACVGNDNVVPGTHPGKFIRIVRHLRDHEGQLTKLSAVPATPDARRQHNLHAARLVLVLAGQRKIKLELRIDRILIGNQAQLLRSDAGHLAIASSQPADAHALDRLTVGAHRSFGGGLIAAHSAANLMQQ